MKTKVTAFECMGGPYCGMRLPLDKGECSLTVAHPYPDVNGDQLQTTHTYHLAKYYFPDGSTQQMLVSESLCE